MKKRRALEKQQRALQREKTTLFGSQSPLDAQVRTYSNGSYNRTMNKVLEDQLLEDGLISSREDYSFSLSNKKLKVNGKRQSAAVHQKYKELYKKLTGNNNDNGNSRFHIEIKK